MSKADIALGVDHAIQRHTSHLEEIHFLAVHSRHRVIRIGQANKWNFMIGPILLEGCRRIRTDSQNFYAATLELLVIIPQTRQLRATVRSHEAAQKGKQDRLAA